MKNIQKSDSIRIITFKNIKDGIFYGVALEFNVVVSGNSDIEVLQELLEALDGHIETLIEVHERENKPYVSQKVIPEYNNLWLLLEKRETIPSPYQVKFHGWSKIYETHS